MIKFIFGKTVKIVVLFVILGLILTGCASQTSKTTKQNSTQNFEDNFRFVPRIHVEDNSFGGGEYSRCSYDQLYEGYWCPKGR